MLQNSRIFASDSNKPCNVCSLATQEIYCFILFQTATQSNSYPVSNQFMIGDYVLPGNIVLPTQNNLGNITVKTPPLWKTVTQNVHHFAENTHESWSFTFISKFMQLKVILLWNTKICLIRVMYILGDLKCCEILCK